VSEGGLEPPFPGFRPVPSGTHPIASDQPRRRPETEIESVRYPPDSVPSSSTVSSTGGRIEDELWEVFLCKCKAEGLSNTDGMRRVIRSWTGMAE
jgi:hypothetical protein